MNSHITSWSAPHNHMPPPNLPKFMPSILPTLGTKVKCVIAWLKALLIMDYDECSLTSTKVTNPNIIKVAAKSPCITYPVNQNDCSAD